MSKTHKRITRKIKEQQSGVKGRESRVNGNGIGCPAGGIEIDRSTCMVRQVRYPEGCLAIVCEQYGGE